MEMNATLYLLRNGRGETSQTSGQAEHLRRHDWRFLSVRTGGVLHPDRLLKATKSAQSLFTFYNVPDGAARRRLQQRAMPTGRCR